MDARAVNRAEGREPMAGEFHWEPEALYDVVIVNVRTMTVHGFAAFSIHATGGRRGGRTTLEGLLPMLRENLNPPFRAFAVPQGEMRKGARVEWERGGTGIRVRKWYDLKPLVKQRLADGQCLRCGSPALFTRRHCAEHARDQRWHQAKYNARVRGTGGIEEREPGEDGEIVKFQTKPL